MLLSFLPNDRATGHVGVFGAFHGNRINFVALLAVLSACGPVPSPPTSAPPMPISTVAIALSPALTDTPSPTVAPSERDELTLKLEEFGVRVAEPKQATLEQLRLASAAVDALAAKSAEVFEAAKGVKLLPLLAFKTVFGPTVIRIYPDKTSIDGLNAAINCGWEGRYARGCSQTGIFPDQEFPANSWLVLIAGDRVPGVGPSEGVGLIAHELVHNLTWGKGHNPDNVGGYSFVQHVGDEFAIRHFESLRVSAGRNAYLTPAARDANPSWRAELTADAIASWALDEIDGPYAESIAEYVRQSMICDLARRTDC